MRMKELSDSLVDLQRMDWSQLQMSTLSIHFSPPMKWFLDTQIGRPYIEVTLNTLGMVWQYLAVSGLTLPREVVRWTTQVSAPYLSYCSVQPWKWLLPYLWTLGIKTEILSTSNWLGANILPFVPQKQSSTAQGERQSQDVLFPSKDVKLLTRYLYPFIWQYWFTLLQSSFPVWKIIIVLAYSLVMFRSFMAILGFTLGSPPKGGQELLILLRNQSSQPKSISRTFLVVVRPLRETNIHKKQGFMDCYISCFSIKLELNRCSNLNEYLGNLPLYLLKYYSMKQLYSIGLAFLFHKEQEVTLGRSSAGGGLRVTVEFCHWMSASSKSEQQGLGVAEQLQSQSKYILYL